MVESTPAPSIFQALISVACVADNTRTGGRRAMVKENGETGRTVCIYLIGPYCNGLKRK